MLYRYNQSNLLFEKITRKQYLFYLLVFAILFSSLGFTGAIEINRFVEKIPVIIRLNSEPFSEANLRTEIKRLNLKFEEVIIAQYKIETGAGTSTIFRENNNLFGMKTSKLRPSTALGENRNHAYYSSWRESLLDYAFWQQQNARNITTESEYLQLLSEMYAEDGAYLTKLQRELSK